MHHRKEPVTGEAASRERHAPQRKDLAGHDPTRLPVARIGRLSRDANSGKDVVGLVGFDVDVALAAGEDDPNMNPLVVRVDHGGPEVARGLTRRPWSAEAAVLGRGDAILFFEGEREMAAAREADAMRDSLY